eukprot:CAMPEP_0173247098 /NCGR_PEP_ID=MMETSP1142-20121109/17711_1 /TAXON_ID=483371 /ORGANISM="non described non described, Strain CCMP2298" /LENGTH=37 /DNA_ID= /DNA_START= /DNA_END= /DNA_ORIENTATION=
MTLAEMDILLSAEIGKTARRRASKGVTHTRTVVARAP